MFCVVRKHLLCRCAPVSENKEFIILYCTMIVYSTGHNFGVGVVHQLTSPKTTVLLQYIDYFQPLPDLICIECAPKLK